MKKTKGATFRQRVWRACSRVPRGKVTTYALLAKAIGSPKAARAVGNALNANPFAPKVPCHRVVKSDGGIGGFAKGVKAKKRLLEKEGIEFAGDKVKDFKKRLFG